eukprot:1143960-Pelagomonas_calceolata.AAC.3
MSSGEDLLCKVHQIDSKFANSFVFTFTAFCFYPSPPSISSPVVTPHPQAPPHSLSHAPCP